MSVYYQRIIDKSLIEWKNDLHHKPLLLRGARQVGKSSAVRHFSTQFKYYLEINFEKQPKYKELFRQDLDVNRIVADMAAISGVPIVANETLVFFDEVQECQEAIMSLRFFKEDLPSLHVVAAGSLLEFALADIPTFGVGRIRSLFMYPMTFDEFLLANGHKALLEAKNAASPQKPVSQVLHAKLVDLFRVYVMVGGMPEAVAIWVETHDYLKCAAIQDDIVAAYETDFAKYKKKIDPQLLRETFHSVVMQMGVKFVFSKVRGEYRSVQVKSALACLEQAGLVVPTTRTSGKGLPLSAEASADFRKYLLIDSGLALRLLNLELGSVREVTEQILLGSEKDLVNKGHLVEMIAGMELLRTQYPDNVRVGELFYWQKLSKDGDAEVDYLMAWNQKVLPVEIKSETQGGMKSLFGFMDEKQLTEAVRVSLENFSDYYRGDKHVTVVPLYALAKMNEVLLSMAGK